MGEPHPEIQPDNDANASLRSSLVQKFNECRELRCIRTPRQDK